MEKQNRPLVYLACPYSHPERDVRVARFEASNRAAALLMAQGLHVFAPISMSHPVAECAQLPGHWDYWKAFDTAFLSCCHKLIVLMLPGWQESVGVTAEIEIAREMGIEIEYFEASL